MNTATSLPANRWPSGLTRWSAAWITLFLVAAIFSVAAEDVGGTNGPALVRFAFSRSMFRDINENDAKAAMKVYAKTIGDENGIDTSGGPIYLDGTNAIAEAVRLKQVDMISLTSEEYLALENQGLSGPFMISKVNQTFTEEYVLLVRADSPIRKVEDLPGHSLIISDDLRSSLTSIWLEVLCREHGLGPANRVFSKMTASSKVTQVVLPVFFGKADACVTTRNGWEVMGELNPQVSKQLRLIAASAPLVPGMSCFRRDLSEALKQRLIQAAEGSSDKPAFKQLMALFKTEALVRQPASVLTSTRQLLSSYHQYCVETNPANASEHAPTDSPGFTAGKEK